MVLFKIWPIISKYLPDEKFIIRLNNKIEMGILFHNDIFKWRLMKAREMGVKIGDNCRLFSLDINSEPYLLEIGDHVVIADSVRFITHDGGVWILSDENLDPEFDHYGKIKIGNNVFLGMNSIILLNTTIGNNCVIGAGSVVRGKIPDDSIVMGNPAKVIMKVSLYKKMILHSKNTLLTAKIPVDNKGRQKRREIITKALNLNQEQIHG
jgi:acetyltransferase-like isoleucine patch superfamily enzyme